MKRVSNLIKKNTVKLLTEKEKKIVIHVIAIAIAVVFICLLIANSCLVKYKFSKLLLCSKDVSLVLVYKNTV